MMMSPAPEVGKPQDACWSVHHDFTSHHIEQTEAGF